MINENENKTTNFSWKAGTLPISADDAIFAENKIDDCSGILIATDGTNKILPVYFEKDIARILKVDDRGEPIDGEEPLSDGEFIYIAGEMKVPEFIVKDIPSALIIFNVTHCPVAVYMNDENLLNVIARFSEAKVIAGAEDKELASGMPESVIEIGRFGDNFEETKLFCNREFDTVKDYYLAGGDINIMLKTKKKTRMTPLWWMQKRMKSPSWIIKDMIPGAPSLVTVFSPSNVGKTYFVLDAGLTIASGGSEFFGHKTKGGNVLYLCGEGDSSVMIRIQCWLEQHNIEDPSKLEFYFDNVPFYFDEEAGYSEFIKALKDNFRSKKPDVVIVDTMNLFMSGDENSTQDASTFVKILKEFASLYRCTILLVHHTSKKDEKNGRGSSAFKGAVDSEIMISRKSYDVRKVEQTKNRNGRLFEPFYLTLEEHEVEAFRDQKTGNAPSDCIFVKASDELDEGDELSKWEYFIVEFCVARALQGENKLTFSRNELIAFGREKWPEDADKMTTLLNENQKNKPLWTLLRDNVLAKVEGEDESVDGSTKSRSDAMNKIYTVIDSRIIEEIERQIDLMTSAEAD